MSVHGRTLDVIQAFYDAAMDENLWRAALESLCDLTGSQAASFWVLDGSEKSRLPTFICINFDMSSIKEYLEHTASIDPSKNPQCNNLIYVQVTVNNAVVRDTDLNFYLDLLISDYPMQHRAGVALNDALNVVVAKGAQQERNDASKQAVPKL